MQKLAEGDTSVEVPFTQWPHETGRISRAVDVFRTNMAEAEQQRQRQAEAEEAGRLGRRQDMERLADQFQASVGKGLGTVTEAASGLKQTATAMSDTAIPAPNCSTSLLPPSHPVYVL